MFESVSLHSVTPTACLREPHAIREARAGHHTRSHCLLGLGELKGRLLLASWEHGLSTTSDAVVKLLHQAVKVRHQLSTCSTIYLCCDARKPCLSHHKQLCLLIIMCLIRKLLNKTEMLVIVILYIPVF